MKSLAQYINESSELPNITGKEITDKNTKNIIKNLFSTLTTHATPAMLGAHTFTSGMWKVGDKEMPGISCRILKSKVKTILLAFDVSNDTFFLRFYLKGGKILSEIPNINFGSIRKTIEKETELS